MALTRRLAAILVADVVGYSRLMEVDEAGTLKVLKALRGELIYPIIADHRGRVVKLMGDGSLVEFASAIDAVECAVKLQSALCARSAELPAERQLAFRIGINLGDVMVEGDDIYGDGVNVAARLEALAEPGGVYVSDIVRQSVGSRLELDFEDLGEHQVKNIARAVHVFRIRLARDKVASELGSGTTLRWLAFRTNRQSRSCPSST
jgi:adenylate cyclase